MGSIYRPKYKRKDGTVAVSAVWWLRFYRNGAVIRESTETKKEKVAKELLRQREGDVSRGIPLTSRTNRCTIVELLADVVNDYKVNQRRTIKDAMRRVRYLTEAFGERKAASITGADVRAYAAKRLETGLSNASVNHELKCLGKAFRMGIEAGKVTVRPQITKLKENNVRRGFFERSQFESLRAKFAAPIQAVVTFLYVTGWRVRSEVLPLQWRQVDLAAGTVRLDPGTTKNGDGRVFHITAELREVLEAQRAYTDQVQREKGAIIPHVFHRDGLPIREFKRAWVTACKAAGCPGMLRHDFRRTAVRNSVRAGIPERVAMTMTGHKTRSVFERYNIVSEGDLIDAARKLDNFTSKVSGKVGNGLAGTVAAE